MTCPRCSELEREVQSLREAAGVVDPADRRFDPRLPSIRRAWSLTVLEARLLLRLYDAGGRIVARWALMEMLQTERLNTLRVHVYRIRQAFTGLETCDGRTYEPGYRLTAEGLQAVYQAIHVRDVAA